VQLTYANQKRCPVNYDEDLKKYSMFYFLMDIERPRRGKQNQSQSYVTAGGQSASLSWCRAPLWLMTRFIMF